MKTCGECKRSLPEDKFHKRTYKNGKIGLQSKCGECSSRLRREKYYRPHSSIRSQLKLTQEDVDRLTAPGKCEACGTTEGRLCIDHDHGTKKPRGLLCHNCNTALGLLKDDADRIAQLGRYISRY